MITWKIGGKIWYGNVKQLNQKKKCKKKFDTPQRFSFEMANTPSTIPIPLNNKRRRKYNRNTNKMV